MKIGILALLSEMTLDPVSVARRCEELGFESIWAPEHAIIPVHTKVPYPALDGKIPDVYTRFPDPFVLLGMMASVTRTLKLGTGICLVPERHPLALAKEVATLDYYSGGRFLFGIGAGWQAEESEIMGVDFPRRWPITREYVRAMKELWTKPEASFEGRFLKFPPVISNPKPAHKPHPPIFIGAGGLNWKRERAIHDTVAIGDGWMPVTLDPKDLASDLPVDERAMCRSRARLQSARDHDDLPAAARVATAGPKTRSGGVCRGGRSSPDFGPGARPQQCRARPGANGKGLPVITAVGIVAENQGRESANSAR